MSRWAPDMPGGPIDRRRMLGGLMAAPLLASRAVADTPSPIAGITRMAPGLDRIVAPDAQPEKLADGFRWAEGPVWIADGPYLLFSDPPANIVYRWTRADGARPFLHPSGLQSAVPPAIREAGANGLALDRAGRLIVADSGTRAIVRIDIATGKRTILADRFEGKRFNSPNDLAITPSGAMYFSDPTYGLADGDDSSSRELDYCGLYRLDRNGRLTLLDRTHRRPNGVALSPDGRSLYLALSDETQPEIRRYTLDRAGHPTSQTLFRDMRPQLAAGLPGLPDGIKVRADGTVFATGPGGVHICTADGILLGIVGTGKAVANCCIGDDGASLFMTSSDALWRVPLLRR